MFWHHLIARCFDSGRHLLLNKQENDFFYQVSIMVRQRFSLLSRELNKCCQNLVNPYLNNINKKEVVLLPLWFAESLELDEFKIPVGFLIRLGVANLLGWVAYEVYDNLLDNSGDACLLSAANICFREVFVIYDQLLPNDKSFKAAFSGIMDRIESANYWEQLNVRLDIHNGICIMPNKLPNLKVIRNLSDRSLGHALGPIATMSFLGYKANSCESKKVISFFEHYLAARQLGDDAHDWWQDLSNGQLNSASVKICYYWPLTQINLQSDEHILRRIFWRFVIPEIIEDVLYHIFTCRNLIKELGILKNPQYFLGILERLEVMVEKTRLKRKEILKHLTDKD